MTGMNSTISIAIIKGMADTISSRWRWRSRSSCGRWFSSFVKKPAGQYGTSLSFLLFNISCMLVSSSGSSPSSSSSS